MSIPVAAILYKLRSTYSRYTFDVKDNKKEKIFTVNVYEKGKILGSKSFAPEKPMDEFWIEIKEWIRTIAR